MSKNCKINMVEQICEVSKEVFTTTLCFPILRFFVVDTTKLWFQTQSDVFLVSNDLVPIIT